MPAKTDEGVPNQYCCDRCVYKSSSKIDFWSHYESQHNRRPSLHCDRCRLPVSWVSLYSNLCEESPDPGLQEKKEDHPYCKNDRNVETGYRIEEEARDSSAKESEGEVEKRRRKKNIKKEYHCARCSYKTTRRNDFENHFKTEHNFKSVVHCGRCRFETKLKSYMIDHSDYFKHTKHVEVFQCPGCKYETKCRHYLIIHVQRKHAEVFKCLRCPYETKSKDDLLRHQLKHIIRQEKKYKCSECRYEDDRRIGLRRHMIIEHNSVSLADDREKKEKNEAEKCQISCQG